jgi:hypothetical protein
MDASQRREKNWARTGVFDDSASFLVQYCRPLDGYGSRNPGFSRCKSYEDIEAADL